MYYVVIPAYNPDEKLITLLKNIQLYLEAQVILVNDGSSSTNQPIFEKAKQYAILLEHSRNMGKGQALRTAFAYLKKTNTQAVVVTADADGQHTIKDIDRLAQAANQLPNRLILGVRKFTEDIPFRSRFGNKLTRFLFKLQTGVGVSDTQTGLRAFHSQLLPFMLSIGGNRYEYEMNMLIKASQELAIIEVPIQTIYINDNASSHFHPIRDSLLIYKNLFLFALSSLSGFLIDYLVYAATLFALAVAPTALRLLAANSLARVTSSVCNYNLNRVLVFQNTDRPSKTGLAYFGLVAGLFLCDTALLYLFHQLLGLNLYVIKIVVGILLFFVSWFVQKHLIFRERGNFSHEIY